MAGDETHTLLHCPHFSPRTQPAIDTLMLNLRQFDLWAWATYTFFSWIFFLGLVLADRSPFPPLESNSILPPVTAVLITPKGAEPPGSRRIGVIGALVLILPSETV